MSELKWWGVVTEQHQLSQVFSMRGLADSAKLGRQDGETCRVVPVKITVDLTPPPPPPPVRKGLFGRRRK